MLGTNEFFASTYKYLHDSNTEYSDAAVWAYVNYVSPTSKWSIKNHIFQIKR